MRVRALQRGPVARRRRTPLFMQNIGTLRSTLCESNFLANVLAPQSKTLDAIFDQLGRRSEPFRDVGCRTPLRDCVLDGLPRQKRCGSKIIGVVLLRLIVGSAIRLRNPGHFGQLMAHQDVPIFFQQGDPLTLHCVTIVE